MKRVAAIAALLVLARAGAARADASAEPYAGVAIEQLYDSNVMNSRGPDAVTRVTPQVGLIIDMARGRMWGDYRLALHEYDTGVADSSINHRLAVGGRYKATLRLDLDASLILLVGEDPVLLDRPGVAIPQGGFNDLTATTGASWRSSRRGTILMRYTYRRSRFDLAGGPDPLAFDGDEHRGDGEYDYRLTRRWTGKILARAQHFVSFGATTSLGDAVGAGAGLEWRITRLWKARANGGPIWASGSGQLGYFAAADLTRTGELWRIALRGVHDLYGGTSAAEAVWSESIYLDGSLRFTRTLGGRARAGVYRGGVAPGGPENVSGLLGSAQVGWQFMKNARLDAYVEHRAQSAAGGTTFGDLQRTVTGLRLTAVLGTDMAKAGENL